MYDALRPAAAVIAVLTAASLAQSPARSPLLRYVFDKGEAQNDFGRPPFAHGSLQGQAAFVANSPGTFSCGSLDLTPNSAFQNYAGSGVDVDKIDALPAMTVTFWMNMRADPAYDDCLISDMPAGYPPAGHGGWEVRIKGTGGPTASNFQLAFEVMQANGGSNGIQAQTSPPMNASKRWVFAAVTYSPGLVQRYYIGDESAVVAQLGDNAQYSYSLLDNTAELRVGSAGSEPDVDRTPPAWIDDVRIYDRELTAEELDEVRREALSYPHLFDVPGLTALGGVPGSACGVYAQSISADGSTIVGQAFGSAGQLGYRWKDGARALLSDLAGGGVNANALRCSVDGLVVVGWGQPQEGAYEAVRWDAAGQITRLGDFPGGELFSIAYGVSADGTMIAGLGVDRDGVYVDAFRYSGGVMQKLGYLPGGSQSAAYDISADGLVIVGASESAAGTQAFRWEGGHFTALGDLPGGAFESRANKIAAGKQVVVGWGQSGLGREAACWVAGRAIGLGDLPGGMFASEAYGVSAFGSCVVGKARASGSSASGQDEAFIWNRKHGMRSLTGVLEDDHGLDVSGWRMIAAVGISDDGSTITGFGTNPAGLPDSFLVRLPVPPAPADLDLDEDVDAEDLAIFIACASGPGIPYRPDALPAGCDLQADALGLISADFDWDGDVDAADFAFVQRCLSGPGDSPSRACRG